jgi:GH15 family glucan-1,4-alpha-glucosidase
MQQDEPAPAPAGTPRGYGLPIEDYAVIGDRVTAAIVGRNGSIDWLCLPHFDGGACFAALLGDPSNGRWQIAPAHQGRPATRAYQGETMILETVFETSTGTVALIDFMVPGADCVTLVRLVQGRSGHVPMHMDMALRFDYGISVPWVTQLEDRSGMLAIAGPNMVVLRTAVKLRGQDMRTVGEFTVHAGQTVSFVMAYHESHLTPPAAMDPMAALESTRAYWADFISRSCYDGPYKAAVHRSLLVLKALSYAPTGGIVAAVTTSLPEQLGGGRNWDYRYCWLRDASLTLFALMGAGFTEEAVHWRDWLQRSVAGNAAQIQIMYGLHGERSLDEREIPWLAGYEGSKPVRVGNAASEQVQLDVYGEVLECLHQARRRSLKPAPHGWALQKNIIEHLAAIWEQPDEGMWEIRGAPRHFTLSKVMAWVAVDRMIKDATHYHLHGPIDEWRALRDRIRDRVLAEGYDATRNTFTQSFGSTEVDASLLLIPQVGFLPPDDPRVVGTIAAVESDLLRDGYVLRYRTQSDVDGLPPGEGAFLACTYWLVEAYAMQGRTEEAHALFERLLGLANDLGLMSEEYDVAAQRQVGNFPQAFSHVALVAAAMTLHGHRREDPRVNG